MTTSTDPTSGRTGTIRSGITTPPTAPQRQIGPIGTVGRLVLGAAFIGYAGNLGAGLADILIGLVAANAVVFCVMAARGADAPPMRFTGPGGHLANFAIGIPFVTLLPQAGLVFYGSGMLLAAARGFAACEMLAVCNLVRGRDDRIGCPVFSPLDTLEERVSGRPRDC